mgnify:CR=1 FL=1|tara:strand:- start:202 stop:585 length:384 start_codon:yes stop_codon:yes gene_type:complete
MTDQKYYESREFLKLRREFYEKLKDDGFKDIEITDWSTGESGNLLRGFGHMDAVRRWTPDKERYYQLARQKAHKLRSRKYSKEDRKVWRLHAEGESFRGIERRTGVPRGRVSRIVKRIAEEMLSEER